MSKNSERPIVYSLLFALVFMKVTCAKPLSASKHLCLPRAYNKFDLPLPDAVNTIDIGIDIVDVLRINDKEYSVEFSSYFNVMWREPRLYIPESFTEEINTTDPSTMVPVNLELVNHLWLPNVFIYNLKTFKVVQVLSKHAGLWVTVDQEIMYSQSCKFQVGSYSYDMTKMNFTQTNKVQGFVKTANSVVLDYKVDIIELDPSDFVLNYGELGNFSVAGFEMRLRRHVSHYLITYYLPSGLFVVVSWISFVVPPDVIPGRMALLITLFLVLVNIFNTVTTNTPKAEGLTAIEIWMLSCLLFVFGALVEYAVILFKKQGSRANHPRRKKNHVRIICNERCQYEVSGAEAGDEARASVLPLERPVTTGGPNTEHWRTEQGTPGGGPDQPETRGRERRAGERPRHQPGVAMCGDNFIRVDRLFLVLSPILFLIFNIFYWLSYCRNCFESEEY